MTLDRNKLSLAMARACLTTAELATVAQMPRATLDNAIAGRSIRPATLGKIARALGCDPADIIEEEP